MKKRIFDLKNSSEIGNRLHVGDELCSIDGITDEKEIEKYIAENSTKTLANLKLKRLPFGRLISLPEYNQKQINQREFDVNKNYDSILINDFGIKLKPNTSKIEKIIENGLIY